MQEGISLQKTEKNLGKNVGRAIAKYRQSAKLTQAEVAEILNISIDAVSRMERGIIMPSVARLIELAEIFDCEAADLLTASSPRSQDQSQYLFRLLNQLNEQERWQLIHIIESMINWHKKE